jgi:hypothetical protein
MCASYALLPAILAYHQQFAFPVCLPFCLILHVLEFAYLEPMPIQITSLALIVQSTVQLANLNKYVHHAWLILSCTMASAWKNARLTFIATLMLVSIQLYA